MKKTKKESPKKDSPKKPYWVEEEDEIYYHPYMQAARQTLKEEEKKFNE